MKIFIYILLFVFAFSLYAQKQKIPDGFIGIKWGESVEKAKKKMFSKEGVELFDNSLDAGIRTLSFIGGNFAGYGVNKICKYAEYLRDKWILYFWNGKFYEGSVYFYNGEYNELEYRFDDIEGSISKKYGKPSYSKLKSNLTILSSGWRFSNDITIRMNLNKNPFCKCYYLDISYRNDKFINSEKKEILKEL